MAPHSSTLAWKIPWSEEPGGLQSMELQRVGYDGATNTSYFSIYEYFDNNFAKKEPKARKGKEKKRW